MMLSKTLAIDGFIWIHTNVTRKVLVMHSIWLNEGVKEPAGDEAECRRVLPNKGDLARMVHHPTPLNKNTARSKCTW